MSESKFDNFNLGEIINNAVANSWKNIGKANVLIAGKTGVGKSTLINAVFNGKLAETGQGKPVTQEIKKIEKEGVPLAIYDTKGLEVKDYESTLEDVIGLVNKLKESADENEHLHVAWICIKQTSSRIEAAEIDLAKRLYNSGIPVIAVITNTISDNPDFKVEVKDALSAYVSQVLEVNSEVFSTPIGDIQPKGLSELVEATLEIVPESQRKAFAAAQKVRMDLKVSECRKIIMAAAATAATAAATPIPLADAVTIVPIQIGMFASISAAFGLKLDKGLLYTIVSSLVGATAATLAGRTIASNLLKFVPGIGSVVGGAISATTAGLLTTTIGELYVKVLVEIFGDGSKDPLTIDPNIIANRLKLNI